MQGQQTWRFGSKGNMAAWDTATPLSNFVARVYVKKKIGTNELVGELRLSRELPAATSHRGTQHTQHTPSTRCKALPLRAQFMQVL